MAQVLPDTWASVRRAGARARATTTSRPTSRTSPIRTPRSSSAPSTTRPATSASTRVDGAGPFAGSELMWIVGPAIGAIASRGLLTAASAARPRAPTMSRAGSSSADETVADPQRRAALWRDLADGARARLRRVGRALLAACGGRLGGDDGLIGLLRPVRRVLGPAREEGIPVREDRRAPRLARGRGSRGLGGLGRQRAHAARTALRAGRGGAARRGAPGDSRSLQGSRGRRRVSPPILDDLLWELGRENPDLLGRVAGRSARTAARPRLRLVLKSAGSTTPGFGFGLRPPPQISRAQQRQGSASGFALRLDKPGTLTRRWGSPGA